MLSQLWFEEKTLLINIYEPIQFTFTARQYGQKYKPQECQHMNLTVVNIQQANMNTFVIVMFDFDDRV